MSFSNLLLRTGFMTIGSDIQITVVFSRFGEVSNTDSS